MSITASYPRITLPSGQRAWCRNIDEARFLAQEMPGYFRHGITLAKPTDGSLPVVFDVGANIGLFTLYAHHLAGGDIRLYAFEPIPQTFELLALNAATCGASVAPFNHALGREEGEITFTHFPSFSAWSSAHRPDSDSAAEQARMTKGAAAAVDHGAVMPWLRVVPKPFRDWMVGRGVRRMSKREHVTCRVRTLTQVIDEERIGRIDLLKVDVEGGEMDVLAGLSDAHWPLIQQAVVEVEQFDSRGHEMAELFRNHGFAEVHEDRDEIDRSVNTGMLVARRAQ